MFYTMEPDVLSNCLMELDQSTRDWYMLSLTAHITSTQGCAHHSGNSTQAEALTGSQPGGSNVERNISRCDSGPQACSHSRRDATSELIKDIELQQAAVKPMLAAQEAMEPYDEHGSRR